MRGFLEKNQLKSPQRQRLCLRFLVVPRVVTSAKFYSTLSSAFLVLNAFYRDQKRINVTSADVLRLLLRIFFTLDSAVLLIGAQKYFFPRAQGGTLATPLG